MGYGTWSNTAYRAYSDSVATTDRSKLFHRTSATSAVRSGQEVNVEKIGCRESRDSPDHPVSTPILVGLDVTGSMGMIPEYMVKQGLGEFVGQLLQRKPIPDSHLLFLAIGDAHCDRQPLQATQFESDNRICDQLTDLFLEGGGGGNNFESYDLAWAFAAYRTKTDAWEKRKAKGFVFTVGDEEFPRETNGDYLRRVFGNDCPQAPTPQSLLEDCRERHHVFHVVIAEGSYCRRGLDRVKAGWKEALQRRALVLSDYHRLAELIVSTIAIEAGESIEGVLGWWDQSVAKVISDAIGEQA